MGSTPKYRLVYFDVRALAEPIRWIFAYTGTPYVDERIPWNYPKWFAEVKPKFSSTVGQIPVLHEEGKRELSQSQTISRYLAKQFGLAADNDFDNAKIDEVVGLVHDLFVLWRTTLFEQDPKVKAAMRVRLDDKFKLYYAKFDSILQESAGDYVLGDKLTHADFWLANFISIWDDNMDPNANRPVMPPGWPTPCESDLYIGFSEGFPHLKKHKEKVQAIPQIKEWISKRNKTIG